MGIPSYFSFIVKNHANIIRKINKDCFKINNLYSHFNILIDQLNISTTALASLSYQIFENQCFANLAYAVPNYLKEFEDNLNKIPK